jgi:hypothetical protein
LTLSRVDLNLNDFERLRNFASEIDPNEEVSGIDMVIDL